MEVYEGSMFPSIKLEGKILLVEGNLYCNADRMSSLIEIELSFGKLIIGGYHRIFILLKQMNYYNLIISGLLIQPETYQGQRHFSHTSIQAKRLHQSQILSINHFLM